MIHYNYSEEYRMNKYTHIWIGLFLAVLLFPSSPKIKGVDCSYVQAIEKADGFYKTKTGENVDFFSLLAQSNINTIRIRLWNNKSSGAASLADCIEIAKRAKNSHMQIILDFHYSDTWADPSRQTKPAAWKKLTIKKLGHELERYTRSILQVFYSNDIYPEFVQIGNEISAGFLWDSGKIGGKHNKNIPQFIALLKQAIKGARTASKDFAPQIIIHHHDGSNYSSIKWFYSLLRAEQLDYDIIGLSYYPFYSKDSLDTLAVSLAKIQKSMQKPTLIVETAYPWTMQWKDSTQNVVGETSFILDEYPATPNGQKNYLRGLMEKVESVNCLGVVYWGGEWISTSKFGSTWENLALFDFDGMALPGLTEAW